MLLLRRPSDSKIQDFVASQRPLRHTYSEVGATRTHPPPGYTVDQNRIVLGTGAQVYGRAVHALRSWTMFRLGWVEPFPDDTPIVAGEAVGVIVRWCGLSWLNACRIVYVIDEQAPVRRFGFAYGTLPEHAESGEERFSVEWHDDDAVWYDLLAFSRPHQLLAKVGRPFSRALQKRFARDSLAAMVEATRER